MSTPNDQTDTRDARTLLWMSAEDHARLHETTLLIVGCGGTGNLLAVNAAFVGFHRIIICDADKLARSNLNRFVYGKPSDIGRPKAELVAKYLAAHVPEASVTVIAEAFPNQAVLNVMAESPVIVAGCVDDTRVRAELDVACRRFGRTLVDLGSGFARKDERIVSSGGQVLVSRPDGPCLMCLGFTHLLNENDYMVGPDDSPQPSLLLLNSVVAALALECIMKELVGGSEVNTVDYSRDSLQTTAHAVRGRPDCMICGEASAPHIGSVMPNLAKGG